jgi:hypothetical protein
MFLQVFSDGTVIDSEGVHRLGPADLRPLVELIQSGELGRLRGHCGTPSSDFIEHVQMIAFERRMGRLQAHSFSYSGNPQGCDEAVRRLHAIVENIQARVSRPASASPTASAPADAPLSGTSPAQNPGPLPPPPASAVSETTPALPALNNPSAPAAAGPVIPLTPLNRR